MYAAVKNVILQYSGLQAVAVLFETAVKQLYNETCSHGNQIKNLISLAVYFDV